MTDRGCTRRRKFTPETFFISVLHLVAGTNGEGYLHALARSWRKCSLNLLETPSKSSLSEFRSKISFEFFKDIFTEDLRRTDLFRKKLRGFYIYAADGDQLDVAPSTSLIESGYRGYPTMGHRKETHYLKVYTAQVYDVINGLVKDFRFAPEQSETELVRAMVPGLEKKSITIYDRLYAGYPSMEAHFKAGNSFLIRARIGEGHNVQREVRKFRDSKTKSAWINWKPQGALWLKPSISVRLVKVKHPQTREMMVYITNLKEDEFSDHEIAQLYLRRWDIEGSFRDLTATLKLEQWHSKNLNGVLQEVYTLLWLANKVKFACFAASTSLVRDWILYANYRKSNFKLCINIFMDNLELLIQRKFRQFRKILFHWIEKTVERRCRISRRYPRAVKRRGAEYAMANIVPRRA